MKVALVIVLVLPLLVFAQSGLNVTGRISLRTLNTDYDEKSDIKPDSVAADQYAKTHLIPGLSQNLNIALFARTSKLDMTLLGDLQNNAWNKLDSYQNVRRLSLSARFGRNEIVLGDFFDSGSEFFIQSREVRGLKVGLHFEHLWNTQSYLKTKISAGEVQKAFAIGSRLQNIYHQYENAGQFRRYLASAVVHTGDQRFFDIGLKYLYAKDDDSSISESLNEPLINQTLGASARAFLWQKHIQLFAEGYYSRKDTLSAQGINDNAYKAGFDLRYNNFKLKTFYQRLGYDYYSAGYPFLENDRQGLRLESAYYFPKVLVFSVEGEEYHDNLNNDALRPVTDTRLAIAGLTTQFKGWPEFSVKYRFRDDISDVVSDSLKTDRLTTGVEGGISLSLGRNRLSLSSIYLKLDDNSVLASGKPLGTEQWIASLNFYTKPVSNLFLSGGSVYSTLHLTNEQDNKNLYAYISGRWDALPGKLKLEASFNYLLNDAANGGTQDLLSDYNQFGSELSLEYFFNSNVSFKIIGGNDFRNMGYELAEALAVIAQEDYGPLYFNGFESYNALKYGAELNWIF